MVWWIALIGLGGPLLLCACGVMAAVWLLHLGGGAEIRLSGVLVSMLLLVVGPLVGGGALHLLSRWSLQVAYPRSLSLLAALVAFLGVLCAPHAINGIVSASQGALPSLPNLVVAIRELSWCAALSVGVVMGGVLLCELPIRIVAAAWGVQSLGACADSIRWVLSVLILVVGWSLIDEELGETALRVASALRGGR